MRRDLEQRLKRLRRVPAPESLDPRMEALFHKVGQDADRHNLEQRMKLIHRLPVPEGLDRRMDRLFNAAAQDTPVRHPWRRPAWSAAAIGLILVASFLFRGGFGPEPLVVEIMPEGRLEQFLLGGETSPASAGLEIFTRGDCCVETVWPADAPDLDRRPMAAGRITGGTGQ